MRARNIKPSLFKNELLGTADPLLTILFEGLWCESDREGRLEDRPTRIRAEVFPYRPDVDINAQLQWLHDNGFIRRYVAKGLNVIQILKFLDHQRPHKNEVSSVLPTMDEASTAKVRRTSRQGTKDLRPNTQALCSDPLFSDSGSLIPDPPSQLRGKRAFDPGSVPGLNPDAWKTWVEYRAERKPPIKAASMQAAAEELAEFGADQMIVVRKSMASGYQGLFAKSANGSGAPGAVTRPRKTADELEAEELARNAQH